MKRDLTVLASKQYDVVVVGGGIFGICCAWDAVLRGLSVALVEGQDFSHATSANCFKMVHGGIRYLQHGDIVRIRESARERSILLSLAPHLVRPLPIVIPTYGHGKKGKELLGLGLFLYDLLTCDRNRRITSADRRIPPGGFISRDEVLTQFPELEKEGLTGAAVFYDGQMYSPQRLALSFLRAATNAGVDAANYVAAHGFLRSGDRVLGIKARDTLTNTAFDLRSEMVVNAAGPWAEDLLGQEGGLPRQRRCTFSRDAFFIVPRKLIGDRALAVSAKTKDPDAILSREARHLFLVPWQDYTIIGVWHVVHNGTPDDFTVTEQDLQGFIDEINWAYPAFGLTLDDVNMWNAGLVLFGENRPGATDLSYGKRSKIIDHKVEDDLEGLVTLIGVRYTTARGDAEKVIDLVARKIRRRLPRSRTAATPIYGGGIKHFGEFLNEAKDRHTAVIGAEAVSALVHNHGSEYEKVLGYLGEEPALGKTLANSKVIRAEVVHAVRREMAQKLADVVFCRTDLGAGGHPGYEALNACATLMGREMGWDQCRVDRELREVDDIFAQHRFSSLKTAQAEAGERSR